MEDVDKGCLMTRMGVSECFFWYQPTRVVLDKRLLNGCVYSRPGDVPQIPNCLFPERDLAPMVP